MCFDQHVSFFFLSSLSSMCREVNNLECSVVLCLVGELLPTTSQVLSESLAVNNEFVRPLLACSPPPTTIYFGV